MLPTTNGNLIFSALGSVAAPTSVVSVNPQVATAGLLSSSSVSGGGVKAIAAQYFSNSCAVNASASLLATPISLADAVVSKGISSIFAPGAVSLFDSPCYVSVDQPDVVNTTVDATFYAGGYSIFEKNAKMYSEMDENEAAKQAGREDDDDEDDEANDNANATTKKSAGKKSVAPAAKVRSANIPLAVVVVRGHRTATLSPCRNFIYVLRTDSLALDWAVDLSAYRPPSIKQLILLDAHRLFILTDEGEVFFASRALVPSAFISLLPAPTGHDNTDSRLQSDNKFRYFVTKEITPVTIKKSEGSLPIVSFQPLKCAHVGDSGSINVDIVAVLRNNGTTNTFTVTSGVFTIAQRHDDVSLELAASSQVIETTVSPSSFLVSVASAIDASSKKKSKGTKIVPMNVLVTPLGAAISTTSAAEKPLTLAHLVAMDGAKLSVSSVTPVTVAAADVRKRGGASTGAGSPFFVSATTAELLNESMLSVGIVRGEGSAASASHCAVTGMAVLGTFYVESEENASAGFMINTSAIHLSDETSTLSRVTSSSATTPAVELAPVGFYYNARLNQQTIVTISSLSTSTSSSAVVDSSADAISVRICGISLLSGFPVNGSAVAKGSWVSVNSVLSGNNGNNVASLNNNNAATALLNISEEVDRYTSGGKRGGLECRNFVTLNYPILTLSEISPVAYLDPYRINSSKVFGRCAVTAPVAIHARTLTQWPNAVIGMLKMLVDFTTIALAHAHNIRYAHETLLLGGETDVPLPPTTAAGIISTGVLELFKKLALSSKSLSSLLSGNAAERNNSTAFEVSILTHAFHPSAVRNALRRLPFAVKAAAAEAAERAKLNLEQEEAAPMVNSPYFQTAWAHKNFELGARQRELEEREDRLFKEENDRIYRKNSAATITTDDLVNGLFAALLDGVDASSSQLVGSSSSSAGKSIREDEKLLQHISADSFLRSAVGALEVCHQLITLQTQIGASLKGVLVSRFVLLLRSLRVLGGECDQIAGRLSATLDRQRVAAANAEALATEKAMIRKYQEESLKKEGINSDEAGAADDNTSTHNITAAVDVQQKVNLSRADIRHKIAAVGTGNVADSLSAQLRTHKKVLDLVESKIEAKLKAREAKKKQNEATSKAAAFGLPLYASAGMRQLKSDFQDGYERFLLLGVSNKQ